MWRFLLIACLHVASTTDATACSCGQELSAWPPPGHVGVPTNLREVYFAHYAYLPLGASLTSTVGGFAMPVQQIDTYRFVASVPETLQPMTTYDVIVAAADNRTRVTRFTTGPGPDDEPPPTPSFQQISARRQSPGESTCQRSRVELAGEVLTDEEDPSIVTLEFAGGHRARHVVVVPFSRSAATYAGERWWFLSGLGTGTCDVRLELDGADAYVVRAWATDMAGNVSEPAVTSFNVGGCSATSPPSLVVVVVALGLRRRRARRVGHAVRPRGGSHGGPVSVERPGVDRLTDPRKPPLRKAFRCRR